jgi:hypothetical protein
MAVLDQANIGTQRVADPASRGQRGVSIHVPYWAEAFHSLVPFIADRERDSAMGRNRRGCPFDKENENEQRRAGGRSWPLRTFS